MTLQNWLLLILLSLLWGGSFIFSEIALNELSPLVIVWGRVGIAALFLIFILLIQKIKMPSDAKSWRAFFVMGALNNAIPFCLIVWGQEMITGSLASIFNACTPLFTIVLAHFLTKDEKLTPTKGLGVVLGIIGVTVMIGWDALTNDNAPLLSQMAILGAAFSYGCAAIWGRRFGHYSPIIPASGQIISSTILITPFALIFGFPEGTTIPGFDVVLSILALACLCTVAAYLLYFKILKTSGAGNLMLVTLLVPVSALIMGSYLLAERLNMAQSIGMTIIILSLIIIDGRLIKAWQRR